MQVLYKDEEGFLAVMEVTKAAYIEDEELMEICGPEEDIAVAIDAKSAEKAIRELYANGKADLSAYEYQDRTETLMTTILMMMTKTMRMTCLIA